MIFTLSTMHLIRSSKRAGYSVTQAADDNRIESKLALDILRHSMMAMPFVSSIQSFRLGRRPRLKLNNAFFKVVHHR